MRTKVQKWGNSLALRIPKAFVEDVGLQTDSAVEITIKDGQIVICPIPVKDWTLEQLLAGVTESNLHAETDTGSPQGGEIW